MKHTTGCQHDLMTRDGVMGWLEHIRVMEKRTGMPTLPYGAAADIAWAMRMKALVEAYAESGRPQSAAFAALLNGTKEEPKSAT